MASKKCNAVHPLNVFTIPLSGPGFQQIIRKQPRAALWKQYSQQDLSEEREDDHEPLFQPRIPRLQISTKGESPKGLESLAGLDHLFLKQSQLITEFFLNIQNKYEILNSSGEFVFLGAETSTAFTRIFCFGGAPFDISVNTLPGRGAYSWNAKGTEVLKLTGSPGSCGCGSEVSVTHARAKIGTIEQEGDCLVPLYIVRDKGNQELLQIQGPPKPHCFSCTFTKPQTAASLKFDILGADGKTLVGRIAKQWADPVSALPLPEMSNGQVERNRETVSTTKQPRDCEMWGIKFPVDADLDTKGLLLSALFLLEYQYYTAVN